MLCQAGRSSFALVFRGGHLRHGPGMHIRAHEPGEKFPCRRGKSCAPGAPCHTSSGLLGPGFWPFGKQGCSGLLPSQQQQQQLSPAPDTSLLPVPWHWPDPKSHCWHNSCQGRTEHCGHRTGPGRARCHQPGSGASVRQAPHGHLPKGWEEGGCKTPAGESSSPFLASSSPLWGRAQAIPMGPREISHSARAGVEVPSLLPACLAEGPALPAALPLQAAEFCCRHGTLRCRDTGRRTALGRLGAQPSRTPLQPSRSGSHSSGFISGPCAPSVSWGPRPGAVPQERHPSSPGDGLSWWPRADSPALLRQETEQGMGLPGCWGGDCSSQPAVGPSPLAHGWVQWFGPLPEQVSLRCRGAQLWQQRVPHGAPGPSWTWLGRSGSWALVLVEWDTAAMGPTTCFITTDRELHFQKITLCLSSSRFFIFFPHFLIRKKRQISNKHQQKLKNPVYFFIKKRIQNQ